MTVLVVDYGMGNLGSVRRSLEECRVAVIVSDNPDDLRHATRIVLPGVGAFGDGMEQLHAHGWADALRHAVVEGSVPLLGICLGMQLLADLGYEGGKIAGLGLLPGTVRLLAPDTSETRIPHVGWNDVHPSRSHPLFDGIPQGSDFYFVHSYHFVPANEWHALSVTPYCGGFVSSVGDANVLGVQFHPEKSSLPGRKVLNNFIAM